MFIHQNIIYADFGQIEHKPRITYGLRWSILVWLVPTLLIDCAIVLAIVSIVHNVVLL